MAVNKNNKPDRTKQNSSAKNTGKKNRLKETSTPLMYLIPFMAVLAILPVIIRYKSFENHLATEYWHNSNATSSDIFLYYKSVFLIAFGAILLFMLIMAFAVETKKFKFEIEYAPLTVYLVFVLLSTFASENIYFSLHGIENHFESMWVLLAYIILVVYGCTMADNTHAIKVIIYGLLAGTWILMIIGVCQAFKLDMFTTEWIKKIILPSEMWQSNLKLNFELGQVYITLYNPNYVGYFAAITIPIFLTLAIYAETYVKKAIYAVTVIGVFICSIGSGAKNGLLALAVAFVFMIAMFRRQIIKRWPIVLAAFVILIGVFFGINAIRHNSMINSIKASVKTMFHKNEDTRHLDSITCGSDYLTITYDGKPYKLSMNVTNGTEISVLMTDGQDEQIATKLSDDQQSIVSGDKTFPFTITPVNYSVDGATIPSIQLTVDGYTYSFSNQLSTISANSTGYFYLNASGKWVNTESAETAVFTNNPKLFSNRGYIWARTLPLLKKHIFLGSGPDTFSMQFPNNDYVNSAYVGFLNQIVTKPHSLYLQIGVQTGAISMIAFIVFFLMYFVRSIMLYWKHPLDTLLSKLGIGIAAGTLGYMVSGLTNDSTITYAPVFWGFMGVGIALNRLVRTEFSSRVPEVTGSEISSKITGNEIK